MADTQSKYVKQRKSYWFSEDTEIWNNSLDIESIDPSGEHLVDGPGKKQHNGSKSLYNTESRGRTPTKSTTVQHRPNTMTNHYPVTKAASRQATNHTGTELSITYNTSTIKKTHKSNRYRIYRHKAHRYKISYMCEGLTHTSHVLYRKNYTHDWATLISSQFKQWLSWHIIH